MSDPRWTDETVGLVAMKICGAGVVSAADACARAALAALADAGLLVEPGSEDRSQWGITWKTHSNGAEQTRYSDFSDDVEYDEDEGGETAARSCVAWHQDHPMGNKGVRLVRRTIRTSPWREAS